MGDFIRTKGEFSRVQDEFKRVHDKLDKSGEKLEEMPRIDERVKNLVSGQINLDKKVIDHDDRIRELEETSTARGAVLGRVERFIWLGLEAVIGLFAGLWEKILG